MQILIVLMVCVSLSLKPCQAKVKESVSVECVVCVLCRRWWSGAVERLTDSKMSWRRSPEGQTLTSDSSV